VLNISKSYHYIKNSLLFLFVLISYNQYAQDDLYNEAQKLCGEKKFEQAIPLIDKAITHEATSSYAGTWHIRAYAYLQYYKQFGVGNTSKSDLLDTAMVSTLKSIKLDTSNEFKSNNDAFIKNGAATYFKLSSILLQDSLNFNKAEVYYNNYKKYTSIFNPTFDLKQKDIEFYNAAGSLFADLYMKNNFSQKYGDIAKTALLKVLDVDNKNISANINLGILYYNQGATLMRMMDYDTDLAQLEVIQENAKKLFKQSLPFMIKVYELDPKAERALESLEGIYSALYDDVKANEFKLKKEALNKQ